MNMDESQLESLAKEMAQNILKSVGKGNDPIKPLIESYIFTTLALHFPK